MTWKAIPCALVSATLLLGACGKDRPEDEMKMGAGSGAGTTSSESGLHVPEELQWADGPPSLPPGSKIAVLEGVPSKPGPFTVRFRWPAGYRVPPHTHPADEHVTVLEGSLSLGMGAAFDEKGMKRLPVGGFGVMARGMKHFAMTTDGVTLQLHGMGPWDITYVNAGDDPRRK